jgi:hypothetical protein
MTTLHSDPEFDRKALAAFAFIAAPPGPRVIDSSYSPESFGNADIGLEGDGVRVRVTRDRGQFFVSLSPSATAADWFDEYVVLQLVGADSKARELAEAQWSSIDATAEAIRAQFPQVVARFRVDEWPKTRAELKALQEQRAREMFG